MIKTAKILKEAHNYLPVIDSLTAHIALVDKEANIIMVNKAWKFFADENGYTDNKYGIGSNYLNLLKGIGNARCFSEKDKEDCSLSHIIADGLEKVLLGKVKIFQKEYPCFSPEEEKWFLLTITPFPKNSNLGAIISHENVTKLKEEEKVAKEKALEMTLLFESMVKAIATTVEKRDPYTAGHQREVARISKLIAEELGWDENRIFGLYLGATIHDIGKIAIPAEMLCKPTRLTEVEYLLIHQHCRTGYDILDSIDFPWPIKKMVHQHHERLDGSGYPSGLKANDICDEAKIIAVADVFEAITAHRPYRPAKSMDFAILELIQHKGSYYDSNVVEALLRVIENGKLGKADYNLK